jgi:imidazolonepropionase-like amidohydrolase
LNPAKVFLFLILLLSLSSKFSIAQSPDFAITHVTIINPGTQKPQHDMTIVVHGSSIASVVPSSTFQPTPTTRIINGYDEFVIPGLWDMHTHFRDATRDLKLDIANGVLGIRNMGGAADQVFPLRDAINGGFQLGPKIIACGPILDGPDSWVSSEFLVTVNSPDEARVAVDALKKQGSDCIKVYDGLSHDSYFAILDEAKKQDLPVVGHLPNAIHVREASDAGQRSIEHGIALSGGTTVEDEYVKRRMDPSTFKEATQTKNFALITEKIATDDNFMLDNFSQKRADDTYTLLAKNHTFITPTLVTEHALTFIDDLNQVDDPRMQYVSAEERQSWRPENGLLSRYRTREYVAMRKREYAKILEEVHRAQTLGVRLLAGTDITVPYTYPGFSLHDELKLFVVAGLTPMQALETATTNPALMLGLQKTWGRIDAGYSANFIMLTADPLANISNTKEIDAVVVNGRFVDRPRLDQLLLDARAPLPLEKPEK